MDPSIPILRLQKDNSISKVKIENVSPLATKKSVRNFFRDIIPVLRTKVETDKKTGKCLGSGIVYLHDENYIPILLNLPPTRRYISGTPIDIIVLQKENLDGNQKKTLMDMDEEILKRILSYLPDKDLIQAEKVDPKWKKIVYVILMERKELSFKYEDTNKKEILKWIVNTGENLKKLTIKGNVDLDISYTVQTIDQFCSSLKTLEINSNSFKIEQNSTHSQNLKLEWMNKGKKIPAELKKGIKYILENSSKLQNLHLIHFEESDLEEMEFPASLKGLRIDSHKYRNGGKLLAKIQKESKEIEKLYLILYRIERKEDLEALKEMGRNIQDLRLSFRMSGSQEISFLSELPNLKKLYLSNYNVVEIDLFQLFSLIPNIENLHLDGGIVIKEFKNADLSKLKNFGFRLIWNKHLENYEKFYSLERMIFYDWPSEWSKTDEFWDSFFKILPHLENVEIIEFHMMNYKDCFYERIKSATQNREDKIRIRIRNQNGKMIPKDENDKFIIEEWSIDDYWNIYWNLS